MPITPLHFGLVPLLNRVTPRRMHEGAFVLANVVADIPVVLQIYADRVREWGGPFSEYPFHALHDTASHRFGGALLLGLALGLLGFKSLRWWLGCLLGALTHVGLDMFVHHDMQPFAPWYLGNPFYFDGAHALLSLVLTGGVAWWLLELLDRHRQSVPLDSHGGHGGDATKQ